MLSTLERRQTEHGRIPFEIPVELAHTDFDDAFEADAVDLGPGGLSLRSAMLPDIGSQLVCSFETVPGGTRISSRGEVVWTHIEGDRGGEFGLRFVDIDAEQRALIDEMVAEHAHQRETANPWLTKRPQLELPLARRESQSAKAFEPQQVEPSEALEARDAEPISALAVEQIEAPGEQLLEAPSAPSAQPPSAAEMRDAQLPSAELELDGVGTPLSARLTHAGGGAAVFEQRLDLLEIGRGVLAKAGAAAGHGQIAEVTLRMDGETPMLEVTVRFDDDKSLFGEFDWALSPEASELRAALSATQDVTPDTVPDLAAPALEAANGGPASHVTMTEFDAARDSATPAALSEPLIVTALQPTAAEREAQHVEESEEAFEVAPVIVREPTHTAASSSTATTTPKIVFGEAFKKRLAEVNAAEAQSQDEQAWAHPVPDAARSSVLVRFLRIIVAVVSATQRTAATALALVKPLALTLRQSAVPALRSLGRRAPKLHALTQLVSKRRTRTTTTPASMRQTEAAPNGVLRIVVLSMLAAASIALGVYALAPAADEDAVPLHRKVKAKHAAADAPAQELGADPTAAAAAVAADPGSQQAVAAAAAQTLNDAYARSMAAQPPPSAAGLAAHSVPSSSPYAIDVRDARPAAARAPAAAKPPASASIVSSGAVSSTASGPSFGAKSVPNAQRFVLRMTAPVKYLQGSGDRTGFSVIIPGSLSMDRARAISDKNRNVGRAMVLNKGDHSELVIRFNDGKSPAFRVSGHGAELEVLIAP